ncbi:MAG: tetratricopeptide repeat protein [Opitutaceae bacterium]
MSPSATPSTPSPAGDDRNLVAVEATTALTFEERLQLFWRKNRNVVLGFCAAVLLAIVGKGAWDYMARQKELEVEKAYAAAATTEQWKAFSAEHPNHPLGGIAQLRIADEAYAASKSADAIAGYDKAVAILKTGPLAARARLGRALSKAQAGTTAEAATGLKQIADDANQFKAVRAEAAYHLTSLAVGAGNAAEAQKYVDQLNQIDPMGAWAQRAIMLRSTLPATPAPAAAPAAAGTETPAAGTKKEDTGSPIKLDLPTKP